jgi:oligogalacturonide lyase
LTKHSNANDQLLYFTTSSLTSNDRYLIYISDRNGSPNLFCRDLQNAKERRITNNSEGYLKSYVYFDGNDEKGFGKASVSLHPSSGKAYYLQGRQIFQTDLQGREKYLAEIPSGQVSAFTHVSVDGKYLCIPTTDRDALDGEFKNNRPLFDIDNLVQTRNLNSYLRVFDTSNGQQILCEKVPRAWITHVQFCPTNSNLILYNHEWPADCGVRRSWLWNGSERNGRSRNDWASHEVWESDGNAIVYHGGYSNGNCFLGKVVLHDGLPQEPVEMVFEPSYIQYGHFTLHENKGLLVSDGYYHMPEIFTEKDEIGTDFVESEEEKKQWGGNWISLQIPNWVNNTITWIPICRHRSNWDSQDSHPHPIFTHDGNAVLFNSIYDGFRSIYRVNIPSIVLE